MKRRQALRIFGGLAWLEQFKGVEADLLKKNPDERQVSVEIVEAEMTHRGIRRVFPT